MKKNIAVVRSVDYEVAGYFFPVEIVTGSASYDMSRQTNTAGELCKCSLKFRMSGIRQDVENRLERLCRAARYRISDVNGTVVTIGSADHPARTEAEETVSGQPGGFIGYEVSVSWEHPFAPGKRSFI